MVQSVPQRNVLFVHAMGLWDNVTNLFQLSRQQVVHDLAKSFGSEAHLLRIQGLDLAGDALCRNATMRGIKEHVAKHGVIDELVINAHGVGGIISRFGPSERFVESLRDLANEMGAPFAKRIVLASCEGFKFEQMADAKVAKLQSLAREMNTEIVSGTTVIYSNTIPVPGDQSWYGRFVKFSPDGTITRDVLDTPPEVVRAQAARSEEVVKSLRDTVRWPRPHEIKAAWEAPSNAEAIRAMGWDIEALAHRAMAQEGEMVARTISEEAEWVARHLTKETPVAQKASTFAHTSGGISWGAVAVAGVAMAVAAAWYASSGKKPKEDARKRYLPSQSAVMAPIPGRT